MIATAILDNHWQRLQPSLTPHRSRTGELPLAFAAAVTLLFTLAFWFSSWSKSSPQQGVTPQIASSSSGSGSSGPAGNGPGSPSSTPPPATSTNASHQRETLPPNPTPDSTPPPAKRPRTQTDISVGVFGNLIAARTQTSTQPGPMTIFSNQSASPSAGVIASFHQQFGPWLGYRIATSYARNTFSYINSTSNSVTTKFSDTAVNGNAHEATIAYAVQGPAGKRVSTDAEAGVGVIAFSPGQSSAGTPPSHLGSNYRSTALGGVGFNFRIAPRFDVRAEYRALVYKNPDFGYFANTRYTVSSEPIVSLTYHFGGK